MGFIFIMTADKITRFDRRLMLSIYMSRANYANQWSLRIPFIMVQQGEVPFVKLDYLSGMTWHGKPFSYQSIS